MDRSHVYENRYGDSVEHGQRYASFGCIRGCAIRRDSIEKVQNDSRGRRVEVRYSQFTSIPAKPARRGRGDATPARRPPSGPVSTHPCTMAMRRPSVPHVPPHSTAARAHVPASTPLTARGPRRGALARVVSLSLSSCLESAHSTSRDTVADR